MLNIKYKCGFPSHCFRIGGQARQIGDRGQYSKFISVTWHFLNRFQISLHQYATGVYIVHFDHFYFIHQNVQIEI